LVSCAIHSVFDAGSRILSAAPTWLSTPRTFHSDQKASSTTTAALPISKYTSISWPVCMCMCGF